MFLAGRRFDMAPDELKQNMTRSYEQLRELADLVLPTGNIAEVDEKLGSITAILNTGAESLSRGDIEHAEIMWGFGSPSARPRSTRAQGLATPNPAPRYPYLPLIGEGTGIVQEA